MEQLLGVLGCPGLLGRRGRRHLAALTAFRLAHCQHAALTAVRIAHGHRQHAAPSLTATTTTATTRLATAALTAADRPSELTPSAYHRFRCGPFDNIMTATVAELEPRRRHRLAIFISDQPPRRVVSRLRRRHAQVALCRVHQPKGEQLAAVLHVDLLEIATLLSTIPRLAREVEPGVVSPRAP